MNNKIVSGISGLLARLEICVKWCIGVEKQENESQNV